MSVATERHAERIPGGRIRWVDGHGVAKAGQGGIDLAEIAVELADPMTPAEFAVYVKSEYERYAKLIPELGIK